MYKLITPVLFHRIEGGRYYQVFLNDVYYVFEHLKYCSQIKKY